jgi:hypothetical protein
MACWSVRGSEDRGIPVFNASIVDELSVEIGGFPQQWLRVKYCDFSRPDPPVSQTLQSEVLRPASAAARVLIAALHIPRLSQIKCVDR